MNNEINEGSTTEYEITVSAPTTTEQFIEFLRANNFNGNAATNVNFPGIIWLSSK
jgi:hypothetical protein